MVEVGDDDVYVEVGEFVDEFYEVVVEELSFVDCNDFDVEF